jgi:AraC family transcriptional regulator
MLMNSVHASDARRLDIKAPHLLHRAMVQPTERSLSQFHRRGEGRYGQSASEHDGSSVSLEPTVEISPEQAQRRVAAWDGMAAEIVQITSHESLEVRFRGPRHLLVVYEQGTRHRGETFVQGLPLSTLRQCKGKLIFVPAGHEYYERQEPRTPTRVAYFYFDPAKMPTPPGSPFASPGLTPRLFFEDATLWDTALKLLKLIESSGSGNRSYFEALGVVLAHELMRINRGRHQIESPARGGLAGWQQRIVTAYIDEHLAEQIPLATLAGLVRLSPYYFCRAFKQSFGVPPHRYHINRRIEQAKMLLAEVTPCVTEIGLRLGFSDTSSFSTAFRKAIGLTPTAYHRSLQLGPHLL